MNNFTYAVGRAAALMLFVVPIAVQILPAGWENVTLGFIFHIGMTWLNEAAHAPSTNPNA